MAITRPVRFTAVFLAWLLNACATLSTEIPTVADERLEQYVTAIGLEIVAVSEHRDRWSSYEFKLVDFARQDILGLSTGNHRIFISYELSRLAHERHDYRWLLRHTLAHEIAHDVMGRGALARDDRANHRVGLANSITSRDLGLSDRIKFLPYSRSAELAADRKGMEYWRRLGWPCGHWVQL
ncbi:MAG: hypothetical protein ACREQ2_05090, partial [Candidatus Binatia bacterium]